MFPKQPLSICLGFALVITSFCPLPAQAEMVLPAPGTRVELSPAFSPAVLRGIKVFASKPFNFDFILEGNGKDEIDLIKYFLTGLTIPEGDLWVNLSPYEKDRIIPKSFGQTIMGRDLLAEDYILKQITASVIYPESSTGKEFWKTVYTQSQAKLGTTQIPVNTFNKVWIIPNKAQIYEGPTKNGQATAYITKATLKVMLEEDYLAEQKSRDRHDFFPSKNQQEKSRVCPYFSDIVRQVVIPVLTKEINEGKNFAQLRQIYNSLILATWYKQKIKTSLLANDYINGNKIKNLSSPNALVGDPETIYQRYIQSFKKGAYNFIKEEPDPITGQVIPRKYFSGGAKMGNIRLDNAMAIPDSSNGLTVLHAQFENSQKDIYATSSAPAAFRFYKTRFENGIRVLSPLSSDAFKNKAFRVDQNHRILKPLDWPTTDSSLNTLEDAFNLWQRIVEMDNQRKDPRRPIIIVDWGCGDGRALVEISKKLKNNSIQNVKLIGFSDEYFPQWQKYEKGTNISFILDYGDNLSRYLHPGTVDLMFSHLGLKHYEAFLKMFKVNLLLEHFRKLASLLSKTGEIRTENSHIYIEWLKETFDVNAPLEFKPQVSKEGQYFAVLYKKGKHAFANAHKLDESMRANSSEEFIEGEIYKAPPWRYESGYEFGLVYDYDPGSKPLIKSMKAVFDKYGVQIKKNGIGLDIGFGHSPNELEFIADLFDLKVIHGVEQVNTSDSPRVENAAQYFYKKGASPLKFRLHHTTAERLDGIKDSSIDFLFANPMQWKGINESMLKAFVRVLRPKGKAVILLSGVLDGERVDPFLKNYGDVKTYASVLVFTKMDEVKTDQEMSAQEEDNLSQEIKLNVNGGIDLNSIDRNLITSGSKNYSIDHATLSNIHIESLTPVITSTEDLKSLPEFLGI